MGVLQPFKVQSVKEDTRNVVVYDAARDSLTSAAGAYPVYSRPDAAGRPVKAKPFRPPGTGGKGSREKVPSGSDRGAA